MIAHVCPKCGEPLDRAIPSQPEDLRQAMIDRTRNSKAANDALLVNLRAPSRFAVPLGNLR